jgi:hypothetical protein
MAMRKIKSTLSFKAHSKVWCLLIDKNSTLDSSLDYVNYGRPFKVPISPETDIDDLKQKIVENSPHDVVHVGRACLEVWQYLSDSVVFFNPGPNGLGPVIQAIDTRTSIRCVAENQKVATLLHTGEEVLLVVVPTNETLHAVGKKISFVCFYAGQF